MSFGKRLAARRIEKGLTQADLGKGLGTDGKDASKSVVYGWEKDQHYPRVDQLVLICQRLDCGSDYLLFGKLESAGATEEALQLAQDIDRVPTEDRQHVIHLCRETIKFAARRNLPVVDLDQAQVKAR